ncbi:MAG TPA: hypothetical protein VJ574_03110 [Candidatus Bathyarchaeia archaeon]|nr:hypothetical protein [Candidatus Bathyarchaeia archaeon]
MRTHVVLLIFLSTTAITAVFLAPVAWPVGFALWVCVVLCSLLLMVRWHSRNVTYLCPACGSVFNISLVNDLLSPHGVDKGGGWKLLTCPRCGLHARASALSEGKSELSE